MKKSLIALAIGGFGIGMTEFVMMGILPDLSKAFDVSIPVAGHLISAYALGVVIGAPLLVAFTGHFPPKKLLIGLMALFTSCNLLSALAPGYQLMLVTRVLAGLPHGAFFGVGAVVAGRLADPGKEARAISVMFAGLTVANIAGVPLGTYIGHNLSWRITFLIVGVVGLLAIWALSRWMPRLSPNGEANLRRDLKNFARLEPWLIIGITAIGTGGFFAFFSYIAPLVTGITGFSSNAITLILIVAGLGMVAGNIVGGRLADRYSPARTTAGLLITMSLALIVLTFAAEFKVPTVMMVFIAGAIAFAWSSPIQTLTIKASEGSEMLASAVGQAAFNTGNALGAYLGGLPIAMGFGYTSADWVGAALALGGFVFCVVLIGYKQRSQNNCLKTIMEPTKKDKLSILTELSHGKFKAFLYDCDGTLADNMQAHKDAYVKVAASHDIELDAAIIDELAGWPTVLVAGEICKRHNVALDPVDFATRKSQVYFEDFIENTKPIDYVVAHFKNHCGKVKIGVVSGGSRKTVLKTLTVLGIAEKVDVLVCAGDTPNGKPYPDPFLLAAEKLGVKPEECLVFEDGDPGVRAAEAAGMKWIRVDKI